MQPAGCAAGGQIPTLSSPASAGMVVAMTQVALVTQEDPDAIHSLIIILTVFTFCPQIAKKMLLQEPAISLDVRKQNVKDHQG